MSYSFLAKDEMLIAFGEMFCMIPSVCVWKKVSAIFRVPIWSSIKLRSALTGWGNGVRIIMHLVVSGGCYILILYFLFIEKSYWKDVRGESKISFKTDKIIHYVMEYEDIWDSNTVLFMSYWLVVFSLLYLVLSLFLLNRILNGRLTIFNEFRINKKGATEYH